MKRVLFSFLVIIFLIFIYFAGRQFIASQLFKQFGKEGNSVIVEIKPGMGIKNVTTLLHEKGIVKKRIIFLLGHRLFFKGETIKAGEYKFDFPFTLYGVIQKLTKGEIYLHQITIPEGSTIFDIASILEREGILKGDDFLKACKNVDLISTITDKAIDLEGFLFPDTYFFPKGIPPEKVVGIMVTRFKEVAGEYIKKAKERGMDFYNILIFASLIEKETGLLYEKPLVSSVFHNRLTKGMLLQCDPTVIYAFKREGVYRYPLKKEDLSYPSPYNTYIHKGLPPGPICNPGLDSIYSAFNPAKTDYLYFVSNGDGSHTFSRDLISHNRAVREYIKRNRENEK